jgi:hypothetical protein
VRKIRINFNVEVAFTMPMGGEVERQKPTIRAGGNPLSLMRPAPAATGHLLYIKAYRMP